MDNEINTWFLWHMFLETIHVESHIFYHEAIYCINETCDDDDDDDVYLGYYSGKIVSWFL
jgi:hypothetical protein